MKNQQLWEKAKKLIPGGVQLFSKRPDRFLPDRWPTYYKKAKGVYVWDLEGNKYLDMSYMGIGACVLGYANYEVDKAVKKAIDNGSMSTLNCPEDVILAEELIKLHPWAGMVRYARCGGEAMAVAVRIARAFTGKDQLAFCGYHGWHDWYIAANLTKPISKEFMPQGVPRGLKDTAFSFEYNKIEELEKIIKEQNIGTIVMEVAREHGPQNGFLEKVRELADKNKIVLVFDEVTSCFRETVGGIHLKYGVNPDICVFGKALANGYPMAAIIGKKEVMEATQTSYISSTFWTEKIGPTAALATIKEFKQKNVHKHITVLGQDIKKSWKFYAEKAGLDIEILGIDPMPHFKFNYPNEKELQTIFNQEMLKKGILATNSVYLSYTHKKEHLEDYYLALEEIFINIGNAIEQNQVNKLLEVPIIVSDFRRLT